MVRIAVVAALVIATVGLVALTVLAGWAWCIPAVVVAVLAAVGVYDLAPAPALGPAQLPGARPHALPAGGASAPSCSSTSSSATSTAGPTTATPARSIYERAKGIHAEQPFGTERDVDEVGLRVPGALDRAGRPASRAAAGPHRRPGLHPALRHGAAERLRDELRRAVGQRAARAQRRRRARAGSRTTPARAA